jgi:hypothetical protein
MKLVTPRQAMGNKSLTYIVIIELQLHRCREVKMDEQREFMPERLQSRGRAQR